ncbi:hypothetical protein BU24DRAFT_429423 [Aaosphaeria arxii CBS 175.79]|uniref:Uncharacterized protein n=1 Tax=Aaosphaeria arxii CBS 175.79 TaxID=1450172 RepID=A0A6A5X6A9_9PLEO|nr:uncharacterized protein BU24DRAFT_429423 [Aaosphaeria arxii CBS 175.79]KAF2008411.1 hypothetical protein BU24DRAFT_429423 [Aaosphaeria arxii CBS 175.79]
MDSLPAADIEKDSYRPTTPLRTANRVNIPDLHHDKLAVALFPIVLDQQPESPAWQQIMLDIQTHIARMREHIHPSDLGFYGHLQSQSKAEEDIVDAIEELRSAKEWPLKVAFERWKSKDPARKDEYCYAIFRKAIAYWYHSMVAQFGPTSISKSRAHFGEKIYWDIGLSFHANMVRQLRPSSVAMQGSLPHAFTMANLVKYHGLQIVWIKDLQLHLKLAVFDDTRVLCIYDDPQCIELLIRTFDEEKSAYKREFLHEILDTLNLLFPPFSSDTMDLLKKEEGMQVHRELFRLRNLDLSDYPMYGERLKHILDIYNGPTTHWWHFLFDRRNKREHFTQLVALWAFVFAFLSLAFGLVSAVYSAMQYQLSIEVACAEFGDHPRLSKHCK